MPSPSITVVTDKTQYVRGETVRLEVANGLDLPVWYIDFPQRDLVFWQLERAGDAGWDRVDFRLPQIEDGKEVCRTIFYERPVGVVTELRPGSRILYEWGQKICVSTGIDEPFEPEIIPRGRYRLSFSYSFETVESKDVENEPWKRPIELGTIEMVYSDEFVLG